MTDDGSLAAEIAEPTEIDEYSWIPEIEISVTSVRSVVEAFARRQSPVLLNEEIERV